MNSWRSGSTSWNSMSSGRAAHVVVGLDVGGAGAAAGLDDVRVEGALDEEGDILARRAGLRDELGLGLLEDADELAADDLPLLLRVGDPGEGVEEALLGVDDLERDARGGDEVLLDLLGLALAHQPVVDVDTGQLGADGLLHEGRGDRGVHTAGQPADGALGADLLTDERDLLLDDIGRRPVGLDARAAVEEVLQDLLAVRGVQDLRVVLDAVELLLVVLEGGDRYDVGGRGDGEALGRGGTGVAVRHPHRLLGGRALEERGAGLGDGEAGAAVLTGTVVVDGAAERGGHQLEAVAHAEHRDPGLEQRAVEGGRALCVHRGRAAGQDDRAGVPGQHLGHRHGGRDDLAVDPGLTDTAGDELGVLRAEVDNEDHVGRGVGGGGGCCWHGGGLPAVMRGLFCRFYRPCASHDPGPALVGRRGRGHTVPMRQHTTFVFTYGIRPAGCHGRAA
ncbi:hypothetical protein ACVWXU_003941 [Streptomyces sp. TE33382]